MRLVQGNSAALSAKTDGSLPKLLAKVRRWWRLLQAGEVDIQALAVQEGVSASYVTRVVRLAFLAPAWSMACWRASFAPMSTPLR